MTDSYVQVATDGSGKKIDNTVRTREYPDRARDSTAGDTVYRQRVVLGDDETGRVVSVEGEDGKTQILVNSKTLEDIHLAIMDIRDMLRMALAG